MVICNLFCTVQDSDVRALSRPCRWCDSRAALVTAAMPRVVTVGYPRVIRTYIRSESNSFARGNLAASFVTVVTWLACIWTIAAAAYAIILDEFF